MDRIENRIEAIRKPLRASIDSLNNMADALNNLATDLRLEELAKPKPKPVHVQRWINVYPRGYSSGGQLYLTEAEAKKGTSGVFQAIQVPIEFDDPGVV